MTSFIRTGSFSECSVASTDSFSSHKSAFTPLPLMQHNQNHYLPVDLIDPMPDYCWCDLYALCYSLNLLNQTY